MFQLTSNFFHCPIKKDIFSGETALFAENIILRNYIFWVNVYVQLLDADFSWEVFCYSCRIFVSSPSQWIIILYTYTRYTSGLKPRMVVFITVRWLHFGKGNLTHMCKYYPTRLNDYNHLGHLLLILAFVNYNTYFSLCKFYTVVSVFNMFVYSWSEKILSVFSFHPIAISCCLIGGKN